MIELVAAVTALAFQLIFEVACFVFWELPVWLWRCVVGLGDDVGGWDNGEDGGLHGDGLVHEADAVATLTGAGIPEPVARASVSHIMQRANIMEELQGLGMGKVEAGRIATLAMKKQKGKV